MELKTLLTYSFFALLSTPTSALSFNEGRDQLQSYLAGPLSAASALLYAATATADTPAEQEPLAADDDSDKVSLSGEIREKVCSPACCPPNCGCNGICPEFLHPKGASGPPIQATLTNDTEAHDPLARGEKPACGNGYSPRQCLLLVEHIFRGLQPSLDAETNRTKLALGESPGCGNGYSQAQCIEYLDLTFFDLDATIKETLAADVKDPKGGKSEL